MDKKIDWLQKEIQGHWLDSYGGYYGDVHRISGYVIFTPSTVEYDELRIYKETDIDYLYDKYAKETDGNLLNASFEEMFDFSMGFDEFDLVVKTKTAKELNLEKL